MPTFSRRYLEVLIILCATFLLSACGGGGGGDWDGDGDGGTDSVVAEVVITQAAESVALGGTAQFVAEARNASSQVIPNAAITWRSGAPEGAPVSDSGLLTARVRGVVEVMATACRNRQRARHDWHLPPRR